MHFLPNNFATKNSEEFFWEMYHPISEEITRRAPVVRSSVCVQKARTIIRRYALSADEFDIFVCLRGYLCYVAHCNSVFSPVFVSAAFDRIYFFSSQSIFRLEITVVVC